MVKEDGTAVRADLVKGVIGYFRSDHWRRLTAALWQDPDPRGSHLHAYVETSIHPNDLESLICGYFARSGRPSVRRIDHMAMLPEGPGSLHGIEPEGLAHFDFMWFYNPDVVLAGARGDKGESGCNLCSWNRAYTAQFYADFPFRPVGAAEATALHEYFRSEHWHRGVELSTLPATGHAHVNVYTSVQPDTIAQYALDSLAEKGWKVHYVCPNVYLVRGVYTGKLVFMGQEPETVYDLGWQFRPDTIIAPAMDTWNFAENPGYDVWPKSYLEAIMNRPYVRLSESEHAAVLDEVVRR